MPAFDPVRDAVLNSPVTQTKPLRLELPSNSYSSSSSSGPESNPVAPSPFTRRATDLSVLLNDDPPPEPTQSLFTPTTPRTPSSFAHLLHSDEPSTSPSEQLSDATPLRRRPSTIDREGRASRDNGYFPPTRSPLAFPTNNAPEPPRRLPSISPHGGLALPGLPAQVPSSPTIPFASMTQATRSRPSTANSSTSEHSAPEMTDHFGGMPSTSRRRSSGASDVSREREGSFSYFTPPTRSPLIASTQIQEHPRSSASPHTRSPASPFAIMGSSNAVQRSPHSPRSSVTSSASSAAPRPVSPTTSKRVDRKPPSSAQMPPPPLPPPALSTPSPLPPKPEPPASTKPPSQTQPSTQSPPAIPMFPRSKIPYAPKHRITPAGSVLVPLSREELERCR